MEGTVELSADTTALFKRCFLKEIKLKSLVTLTLASCCSLTVTLLNHCVVFQGILSV